MPDLPDPPIAELAELTAGLLAQPARISPKYFYDTTGSMLFEQITRLPEYYPTRTEASVMSQHGEAIARAIGPQRIVIEIGAGNCEKARLLCRQIDPAAFVGVDIAGEFLALSVASLRADFPHLPTLAVAGDLHQAIQLPADLPTADRLVFYPGSSIGNFDPAEAVALLQRSRQLLGRDGALLIGVDLVKDSEVLRMAYDDAAGVTADFNLNALVHLNRLLDTNFNPAQWRHIAFYSEAEQRIEMHLEAREDLTVRWPLGTRRFEAGERIHTENSYKHTVAGFKALLHEAGFHHAQAWTDPLEWFAVVLAHP